MTKTGLLLAVLLGTTTIGAPRVAHAEEETSALRETASGATLATDAAAIALFAYARANQPLPLARSVLTGTPTEIVGGPYRGAHAGAEALWLAPSPLFHLLAQDGAGPVAASAALRLVPYVAVQLFEPVGGFVGFFDQHRDAAARNCGSLVFACDHSAAGARLGADIGFFTGAVAAVVGDQLMLWHAPRPTHTASASVVPTLRLDRDTQAVGMAASF